MNLWLYVVIVAVVAYLILLSHTLFTVYIPKGSFCKTEEKCLFPLQCKGDLLFNLWLVPSVKQAKFRSQLSTPIVQDRIGCDQYYSVDINVCNDNLTVLAAQLVHPEGILFSASTVLVTHRKSKLLQGSAASENTLFPHVKSRVTLRFVTFPFQVLESGLRDELKYFSPQFKGPKLPPSTVRPLFYADDSQLREKQWRPLEQVHLVKVELVPTSIGTFRLLLFISNVVRSMEGFGFSKQDTEEMLEMVSPERLPYFGICVLFSLLHSLFAFLAFKHDIGFWREKRSLEGVSRTAVVGNAVSSLIVFLFLLDSGTTSGIVLVSCGISVGIELWKVKKVMKFKFTFPFKIEMNSCSTEERKSLSLDSTGTFYIAILVSPFIVIWSVYSLLNDSYKSWYSWIIASAVKCVYAFGFVMMTPQLFINYKLKSVAHLPWRALIYKTLNTFIDDIFAFMVEMPTIHRIATFRDDVVFFIYLYQMYLYPVDNSRENEFGIYDKPKSD